MIHFYHVTKRFDPWSLAMNDVTFQLEKGEFAFLTGPSGAGKSTLLRLILRQLVPTDGQIVVGGRNLAALRRKHLPAFRREIGMVFQDFKLIERMTVYENLSFVLTALAVPGREHKKRVYNVLRSVSLHNRLNAYPRQLSGGEQQRVAIARAIINDPSVVIADEPTGNLDTAMSDEILQMFVDANLRGSTVLVATHDVDMVRRAGRRVLRLEKGVLVEERPPEPGPDRPSDRSRNLFMEPA